MGFFICTFIAPIGYSLSINIRLMLSCIFRLSLSSSTQSYSKQNININAVNRKFFLSTILYQPIFQQENIMSMPSCGPLLFLYPTTFLFELMGQSVNALRWQHSFLQKISAVFNALQSNVSIPSGGLSSFLLRQVGLQKLN